MYQLGAKSKQRLVGVHPDLVQVVKTAIGLSTQDFSILEGVRSLETQRAYVAKGASQTMASRHLRGPDGYGHAVDLAAWIGMVRWEWNLYPPIAEAMRRAAIECNIPIRWGGCWQLLNHSTSQKHLERLVAQYVAERKAQRRKAFLDGPHFELPRSARYP